MNYFSSRITPNDPKLLEEEIRKSCGNTTPYHIRTLICTLMMDAMHVGDRTAIQAPSSAITWPDCRHQGCGVGSSITVSFQGISY